MEQGKRKSPDTENGAKREKAYDFLVCFCLILGVVFGVLGEHELFQDFSIGGILFELIALEKKIN